MVCGFDILLPDSLAAEDLTAFSRCVLDLPEMLFVMTERRSHKKSPPTTSAGSSSISSAVSSSPPLFSLKLTKTAHLESDEGACESHSRGAIIIYSASAASLRISRLCAWRKDRNDRSPVDHTLLYLYFTATSLSQNVILQCHTALLARWQVAVCVIQSAIT